MSTSAQDILDATTAALETYRGDAVTAIEAMTDATTGLSTFTPSVQALPTLTSIGSITLGTLPTISTTTVGSLGTLPTMGATDTTPTNPNTTPYTPLTSDALPAYSAPALNTSGSGAFSAAVSSLVPTLFTWLETSVQNTISTGGANIVSGVQSAIFDSGLERSQQILQDSLDLAGARVGAKGFRYPNSMLKAAQQELVKNYQNNREDASRKIIETMANFAQQNILAAVSAGTRIDEAKVSVFTQLKSALAEVQRLAQEQYKSDLQANLQVFESTLRLQITDLDVQRMDREEMRAFVSVQREQISLENRVAISEFEAGVKGVVTAADLSRSQAEITNRVAISEFDAGVKGVVTAAELAKFIEELKVSKNEQDVRAWAAYVQQLVEVMKIDLQEVQERNRLRTTAAQATATAYVELIKSMGVDSVALVKS
jgi:DNA-binding ferritin-like protein